ncbi:unnamed protein product [Caenorhabditis brenneri]
MIAVEINVWKMPFASHKFSKEVCRYVSYTERSKQRTAAAAKMWVMTACTEKIIPKSNNHHMFLNFNVGTWIIVGIYPDSTIASFSPWPLILKAYETRLYQGCVQIKLKEPELAHLKVSLDRVFSAESYFIPGFGRVTGNLLNRSYLERTKENLTCWIQYCPDAENGYRWFISSDGTSIDESYFDEKELTSISDFLHNKQKYTDVEQCPSNSVVRHFGFVSEVEDLKKYIHCWSPNVSIETDHTAKIPQPPKHREVESELLPPLIGQWIQYDVKPLADENYCKMKSRRRLSIHEYLPINSPSGIGVVFTYRTVRVMVSCILVKSTDHPMIYKLPLFGFVVDPKSSLVSGSHMQLVLEKTSQNLRKRSGACWRVIDSLVVTESDVTVEKIKEVSVENVPLKDSMELSHFVQIEKPSSQYQKSAATKNSIGTNSSNSRLASSKYQPASQHINNNNEQCGEYYTGCNIQLLSSPHLARNSRVMSKQKQSLQGDHLEAHALVEKIQQNNKSGILWCFEQTTSVHFIYDECDLNVGDYVHVKLEKRTDPLLMATGPGFRWMLRSATKQAPPFKCNVDKNQIYIEDQVIFAGIDSQKKPYFRSANFPSVSDCDNQIISPTGGLRYYVTLHRRKVPNVSYHRYQWSVYAVQEVVAINQHPFIPNIHRAYVSRNSFNLANTTPVFESGRTCTFSEESSKSSSPNSFSPPLDG